LRVGLSGRSLAQPLDVAEVENPALAQRRRRQKVIGQAIHHAGKLKIVTQPGERLAPAADRRRQQALQRFALDVFLRAAADLQPVRHREDDSGDVGRGKW
jgi:hypothetical protein